MFSFSPGEGRDTRSADQEQQLYAVAFEYAPHAMALLSPDGRILNANRAWCRMLGYSADESREQNVAELTHPDDRLTDCEQRQRLAAADIGRYELVERLVRKGGAALWVRLSVSAARRGTTDSVYFVAQIETVPQNRFATSCDDATVRSFRDATFSAIHEIGNSLTPLMLNTEMLVESSPRGDIGEVARQIFKAARRIAFTLRRLRGVEDMRQVAYLGQERLLDLRLVAPPQPDAAGETPRTKRLA
jgi:PAS domain S-box-containing protein